VVNGDADTARPKELLVGKFAGGSLLDLALQELVLLETGQVRIRLAGAVRVFEERLQNVYRMRCHDAGIEELDLFEIRFVVIDE